MATDTISIDKAELLSVLLEALLYGFSLLMFGGTVWILVFRQSGLVNRKMLVIACSLLVCSTVHIVGHIIRAMDGLILYRDTFPGGPAGYFADITQWTFNFKNYVYVIQMLIGDGVILYRCYIVWQSKYIMIMPALLWCAAGVTGFMSCYSSSVATLPGVFEGAVSRWITSFWATSLTTNLLTTILLVFRIWHIDQRARGLRGHQPSQLRPVLHTIVDAGAIYSFTLLAALVLFLSRSNVQYVILDMVTPIISITFYMVIIRVGLTTQARRATGIPLESSTEQSMSAERRRRMQVKITTLTQSDSEYGQRSTKCLSSPTSQPSEVKMHSDGEEVLIV